MLEQFSVLTEGLDHPEGVAWSPRGHIYAGGEAGQIYRIGLDGDVQQVATTGGFVLGLAVDDKDRVYACDAERSEVVRVDPGTGEVASYSRGTDAALFRNPNWCCFAPDGSLFVTDSGEWDANDGLIFRVDPQGRTEIWSTSTPAFPNGCCLAMDGRSLLVVESTRPGVSRIPIRSDGSAGEPAVIAELPKTVPDGVAVDTDGGIIVSCYRPDRIYRITPEGSVDVLAEDPRGTMLSAPTNIAFVGDALDQLVAANLGRWHLAVADVGLRGVALPHPSLA